MDKVLCANGSDDDNDIILPLQTQNFMLLWLLYQQETIKNYANILAKDLEDQFIGMNTKQKVIIKIQKANLDIFSNEICWSQ